MKRDGMALVAVLVLALVGLVMALGALQVAASISQSGVRLRQAAEAESRARSGVEHALLYIERSYPKEAFSLQGEGYQVGVEVAQDQGGRYLYTVRSLGVSGGARKRAKALVSLQEEVRTAFKEGWFTGGGVSVSGQLQLYGARLHGDGGYSLNGKNIDICLPDSSGKVVCQDLANTPPEVRQGLITGSIDARTCNPKNNPLLCQNGKPVSTVCPIWGTPPPDDNRPCWDSLAGRMATVSTATRVPAPNLADLWRTYLGLGLADDPYSALAPATCQYTVADESALRSVLAGAQGTGASICVRGNLTLSSPLALKGVSLYVGGDVNTNGGASLSLEGARLVARGNVNLSGPVSASQGQLLASGALNFNSGATGTFDRSTVYGKQGLNFSEATTFESSKVFSGASINFNGSRRPLFAGNSLLATAGSMIFNGSLKSTQGASPLLVSDGDVTFNGSYANPESASFIWTRGKVVFNENTTFRGGIASGGGVDVSPSADGIVVNGGLSLYKTNLFNEALPVFVLRKAEISWQY